VLGCHLYPEGQGVSCIRSRSWTGTSRLSNTLDTDSWAESLDEARYRQPEFFNTDQGCRFTGTEFTGVLEHCGITISMDGEGRRMDNIFIERLWRTPIPGCRSEGWDRELSLLLQLATSAPLPRLPYTAAGLCRGMPVDRWTTGFSDRLCLRPHSHRHNSQQKD
jgi:transposase InsO family protein